MNRHDKLSRNFRNGDKVLVKYPKHLPQFYIGIITESVYPHETPFDRLFVECTHTTDNSLWRVGRTYGSNLRWLSHYE